MGESYSFGHVEFLRNVKLKKFTVESDSRSFHNDHENEEERHRHRHTFG